MKNEGMKNEDRNEGRIGCKKINLPLKAQRYHFRVKMLRFSVEIPQQGLKC